MKYWKVFSYSQGEILVYGSKTQVLRYMYFRFNLADKDIDSIIEIDEKTATNYIKEQYYFKHDASNY